MVQGLGLGTAPHAVTVYNYRATSKVLMYPYYEDYPTVAEWGQYPSSGFSLVTGVLQVSGLVLRVQSNECVEGLGFSRTFLGFSLQSSESKHVNIPLQIPSKFSLGTWAVLKGMKGPIRKLVIMYAVHIHGTILITP